MLFMVSLYDIFLFVFVSEVQCVNMFDFYMRRNLRYLKLCVSYGVTSNM